jgi:hypothetical protein
MMTSKELHPFTINGQEVDPVNWSAGYVQYLIEYGAGVILQRCTAGIDKDDEKGKKEARDKALEKIKAGQIPTKGGGGGARLTPEVQAERAVVEATLHSSFGFNKTEAAKVSKEGWFALFRQHVLQEAQAEGMDVEEIDFKEAWDDDAKAGIKELYEEEYKIQLAAAKGGEVKVKKTGFLKKS